jgi:hypothetical protein
VRTDEPVPRGHEPFVLVVQPALHQGGERLGFGAAGHAKDVRRDGGELDVWTTGVPLYRLLEGGRVGSDGPTAYLSGGL